MPNQSTMSQSYLTALVGSRICHDLISPLGAIGNGVELLEMSGSAQTPEMSLISESVASANARIRYFRIAFGASSVGQSLGRSEIHSVLDAVSASGRITYRWQPTGDCLRSDVRIVFLLLLCIESSMPFGGEATVIYQDGLWRIRGEAEKMKIDNALWEGLATPTTDIDTSPANVHFALLPLQLKAESKRLRLDLTDGNIIAEF